MVLLVAIGIVSVVEALAWALLFQGFYPLWVLFLIHIVVSALYSLSILRAFYKRQDTRLPWLTTLSILFLGPFGALLSLMMAFMAPIYARLVPSVKELLDEIIPHIPIDEKKKLVERLLYGLESYDPSKVPLAFEDVMAFGSKRQKELAIQRILKNFKPGFAKALKYALRDDNRGIRVLAATAIVRLEKQYQDKFLELEEKLAEDPDNPEACHRFAKHAEEQSRLQFIDQVRSRKLRALAIRGYEQYIALKGEEDEESVATLASLYLSENRPLEALNFLKPWVEKKTAISDVIAKEYMSALFMQKEYEQLREFCKEERVIEGESVDHDEVVDMRVLWKRGVS